MGAGKFDRAEEHFGAAIAAEPRTAEYHLGMAAVMDRLGKLDDAFMELTKASNLDPNNPATWAGLADNNMRRNRPQLGLQYISKARELEPRKAAWRLVEARALNRMNRAEEAVNVLAGLDTATSGLCFMDGREIAGPSLERGVVFQSHALMPWLTVRKNIAFAVK